MNKRHTGPFRIFYNMPPAIEQTKTGYIVMG